MSNGPSIQGEILIDTKSVKAAERSVERLGANLKKFSTGGQRSAQQVSNAIKKQKAEYKSLAASVSRSGNVTQRANKEADKQANLIQKAANKVANFEKQVKESNLSQKEQQKLLNRAGAELKGYSSQTKAAVKDNQTLQNINTKLSSGLGQLQRDLKAATSAQKKYEDEQKQAQKTAREQDRANARVQKQLSEVDATYDRVTASVRASNLEEQRQDQIIDEVRNAHSNLTATLRREDASLEEVAAAQRKYRLATTQASTAIKQTNHQMKTGAAAQMTENMQNLTNSVQVALGPLSGVASRIQALTGLFRRNAAATAAALGGISAFSVGLFRSGQIAAQAQRQQLGIEARLESMGEQARLTGDDVTQMAFDLARATTLSVKQVRNATQTLMNFGNISRSQFDRVIKASKGLSVELNKGFSQTLRKVARTIDDPIDGLQRIERDIGLVDQATKEQIKTLSQQGRAYEATDLILKEISGSQATAEEEAKGLAGALDTLSDNATILAEKLFGFNGTTQKTANTVSNLAEEVSNFANSDDAKKIAFAFDAVVSNISGAIQFAVDNAKMLSNAFLFLAVSAIPKALIGMGKMLIKVYQYRSAAQTTTAVQTALNTSLTKGARAAAVFRAALPLATTLATIGTAIWGVIEANQALDKSFEESTGSVAAYEQRLKDRVDLELSKNRELTEIQRERIKNQKYAQIEEIAAMKSNLKTQQNEFDKFSDNLASQLEDREALVRTHLSSIADIQTTGPGLTGQIVDVDIIDSALNSVENLQMIVENTDGPLKTMAQNLLQTKKETDKLSGAVDILVENLEAGTDKIKTIDGEVAKLSDQEKLNRVNKTISKLTDEFGGAEQKVKELQGQLEEAQTKLDFAEELGKTEKVEKLRKIIISINQEIFEAKQTTEDWEESADSLRSTFTEISRGIRNALTEEDLSSKFDVKDLGKDIRSELNSLSELEFFNLKKELNIVGTRDDVVNLVKEQKKAQIQAEKQAEAQGRLDDHYNNSLSKTEQLRKKFKDLSEDAMTASNSPSQLETNIERLSGQLNKEKQKIDNEANKLVDKAFSGDNIEEQFQQRRQKLLQMYTQEELDQNEHLKNLEKNAKEAKIWQNLTLGAEGAQEVFGQAMSTMEAMGKENTKTYQAIALTQTIISQAMAVAKAFGQYGPVAGVPMAALAAAQVGAQIKQIKSASVNAAEGGFIRGPGTSKSDSIPANLSNGEFVMNANAVQKIGRDNLERMNSGKVERRSSGGIIGSSGGNSSMRNNKPETIVNINDNRSGGEQAEVSRSTNSDGSENIDVLIKDTVKRNTLNGSFDSVNQAVYGNKRKGRKR